MNGADSAATAGWHRDRIRKICERYEKIFLLFSLPHPNKTGAYMNFAREVAESIGYRSTSGTDGDE